MSQRISEYLRVNSATPEQIFKYRLSENPEYEYPWLGTRVISQFNEEKEFKIIDCGGMSRWVPAYLFKLEDFL